MVSGFDDRGADQEEVLEVVRLSRIALQLGEWGKGTPPLITLPSCLTVDLAGSALAREDFLPSATSINPEFRPQPEP